MEGETEADKRETEKTIAEQNKNRKDRIDY